MRTGNRTPSPGERGFSLIELAVSLFIAVQILVAAAVAFDVHNKMARAQTQIADLQQSLRVAQYDIVRIVRSAGRGGIPLDLNPALIYDDTATIPDYTSLALEARNNVSGDERKVARGTDDPVAIEGSDILTIRGCISGSVYQLDPATIDWDYDASGEADTISLTIPKTSIAGIIQGLGPMVEEITSYGGAAIKGRLALVSPESLQNYGVGNITNLASVIGSAADPDSITLDLDFATNSTLNPRDTGGVRAFPTYMSASLVCLIEEYRYYVRALPGDSISALRPRLTRARFEPGTELPYQNQAANLTIDIADGVFDLQVALGLDSDYFLGYSGGNPGAFDDDTDNIGPDDVIYEADFAAGADGTLDDWLYNDPDDRPTDTQYTTHAFGTNAGQPVQTYFVRVTTLARTSRPDRAYSAPAVDTRGDGEWVEDHDLTDAASDTWITGDSLLHRRRSLTTIVEMRDI